MLDKSDILFPGDTGIKYETVKGESHILKLSCWIFQNISVISTDKQTKKRIQKKCPNAKIKFSQKIKLYYNQ